MDNIHIYKMVRSFLWGRVEVIKRLKVIKNEDEYSDITLTYGDGTSLDIWFARNLDLYFALSGKGNTFIIDESNTFVYDAFDKFYTNLINCNLPYENIDKELIKKYTNYEKLVKDNKITWVSDDDTKEDASVLIIEKVNNSFVLTFQKGKKDIDRYISVRICNSGSYYKPFNVNFMYLFHELLKINYEQVYIDVVIDLKRIKN